MTLTEKIFACIEENLKNKKQTSENANLFVSVTGGGGKTTFINQMALFLKEKGFSVLLTTTTKFQSPTVCQWNADLCTSSLREACEYAQQKTYPSVVLFAKPWEDGCKKLASPSEDEIAEASSCFDVTLCEADGSKGLPIKIHTQRDPVIHQLSDLTVAVLGAGALFNNPSNVVFGQDIKPDSDVVDYKYIEEYIKHPQGLLKGTCGKPCIILVNGMDQATPQVVLELNKIHWPKGVTVISGSLKENKVYNILKG